MPLQPAALHTDSDGKRTSAVYEDDGAGTDRWLLWIRDAVLGDRDDAAVTDPATTATAMSVLKGLLTLLRVSAAGIGKAEDAAHASGDTGIMPLAVRRDTAAASSGTTGDYEPLQTDSLGRLRIVGSHLEDAAAGDGDAGLPLLAVRRDTAATDAGTAGDYSRLAVDALGRLRVVDDTIPGYPPGATALSADSGVVADASAVATLAGASSVTTYITGFEVTAGGATGAALVEVTVDGLIGGTASFVFGVPAGVTTLATPLVVAFPAPIPASAANTAINVTVPALGAGNTHAAVVAHGFRI
jgi:hypothetical protein